MKIPIKTICLDIALNVKVHEHYPSTSACIQQQRFFDT